MERYEWMGKALPPLEIIAESGDAELAEVFVGRLAGREKPRLIEFVDGLDPRYERRRKWIINVSTQEGCPVGCRFCDAAQHYGGDLGAGEMLAQVAAVVARHPGLAACCEKLKVHFARMGEPALNDEVLLALRGLPGLLRSPGLWACLATTAPRGRELWFEALLALKNECYAGRFQLQFSLNTSDEASRGALIPVRLLPFAWINAYAARFHRPGERKVALNFALAAGLPVDPEVLAAQFDPAHCLLKLTPLNPTEEGRRYGLGSLSRREIATLAEGLVAQGFEVVLSLGDTREDAIGSNCGQSVRRFRG